MPYIKERCVAGDTIEISKRFSLRYGKKSRSRSDNKNETCKAMKEVNQRMAETKLRRLINHNFKGNDWHMTLTYRADERPRPEESKKEVSNFLKRLRRLYKKEGLELKYVLVTEYLRQSIHHHLIINSIDGRKIKELWPYGRIHLVPLDDTGQYRELANYFVKQTSKTMHRKDSPTKKRWSCSQNLEKPIPRKKIVPRKTFRQVPVPEKGYKIETDSIVSGVSEITGKPYLYYTMIRIDRRKT